MNLTVFRIYLIFLGEWRNPIISRRYAQLFTLFTILLFKSNVCNSVIAQLASHRHLTVWCGFNSKPLCMEFMAEIRGGADKSLARPISWCRRTESIVYLEREVYSCAELKAFSCYRGWKEVCQATRAISTKSKRKLSSRFFSAKQCTVGTSLHSDRNVRWMCTIACHRQKLGGLI
jgi:hypothetical protein